MKLRTEGLSWREIDGQTVILDLRSSKYLRTNRTGTFLLQQLTVERSRDELVEQLVAAHPISHEQAEDDVDAFVVMLTERNLLACSAS